VVILSVRVRHNLGLRRDCCLKSCWLASLQLEVSGRKSGAAPAAVHTAVCGVRAKNPEATEIITSIKSCALTPT
jgi:hypothetical protein